MAKEKTTREFMNIVIAGHVDHGKSTIIGRLLADTHSLPEGKLEQVKENCRINSKPFEYAFLIDALKDEQSQGITIDSARVFFKTDKRNYIIIDAPGHIEFLKNMVTGASRAEAALLVIDAEEGVRENSKRHGYMISMLGIKQIAVLVNKMDLVNYDNKIYENIVKEYTKFLEDIGVSPHCFIPVSGMKGDSVAGLMKNMSWYKDHTVLDVLDQFQKEKLPSNKPFRMPVQHVYKFTNFGDNRRIIAGSIDSGAINVGDEIIFYPSGKKSSIKTIELFNAPPQQSAQAGYTTGFTMNEQIYVTRGEIAAKANEPKPRVTTRLKVNLFWLGRKPLMMKKDYFIKTGTAKTPFRVEEISMVIDASDLSARTDKQTVERHDVAECILKCSRPIAFDLAEDNATTSRFVIIDNYEIWGGGIIREAIEDRQAKLRDMVFLRDYKWEKSNISFENRAEKYSQKSTLILITGDKESDKKTIAKDLEAKLFADGKIVYFLGIGNVLYGVDADIRKNGGNREEHIRRLAEVANIMLDAGVILIVTAIDLTQDDLEILKTSINPDRIETIWTGDEVTTDIAYDLLIHDEEETDMAVDRIKSMLHERGIIFKPW